MDGPFCGAGLICAEGKCEKMCCSDDDCDTSGGEECIPLSNELNPGIEDIITGGEFGYCI
jgi:hypothetical protein